MKKYLVFAVVVLFSAAVVIPASAAPFSIMIGDNDGYGLGVADNATGVDWPGPSSSGTDYDGRSAAEQVATDGAQITDVYSALFPFSGPNTSDTADVIFSLTSDIVSATLQIDMGDFQATEFTETLVWFNGVFQPGLLFFDDGFKNTVVRDFALDSTAIANANGAGEFRVTLQRKGGDFGDFIAFDYFELSGQAVPEPSTLLLLGTGLVGLAGFRRKFKV